MQGTGIDISAQLFQILFLQKKTMNLLHVLKTHSKQSGRRAFRRKDSKVQNT